MRSLEFRLTTCFRKIDRRSPVMHERNSLPVAWAWRHCGLRERGSLARNKATARKPRPVIVSSLRAQAADLVTLAIAIVSRSLAFFRQKGILHDIVGNRNSKRGSVGCCGSKVDAAEYARILYIFESF